MVIGILTCAGKSSRFINSDFDKPKQLSLLYDKPLFAWSLSIFLGMEYIDEIYITVSKTIKQDIVNYLNDNLPDSAQHKVKLVNGGNTRQESVKLALDEIAKNQQKDFVIIHDTARPFVSRKVVDEVYHSLKAYSAAVASLKVVDTLKKVDGNRVEYIDRSNCYLIQTPQGFHFKTLYDSHLKAVDDNLEFTDDGSLVENYGVKVFLASGSILNFKITYSEEFILACEIASNLHKTTC